MGRQRRYPRRPASRSLLGQPLAWQRHPAHRPEAGPRPGGGRCRAASPPHAAPYSPLTASHSPRPLPAAPGTAPWHRGSGDCRQPRTRETARSGVASRVSTGRGAQVGPVSESRPRPRPRPRPGGLCHRSWGGGGRHAARCGASRSRTQDFPYRVGIHWPRRVSPTSLLLWWPAVLRLLTGHPSHQWAWV